MIPMHPDPTEMTSNFEDFTSIGEHLGVYGDRNTLAPARPIATNTAGPRGIVPMR